MTLIDYHDVACLNIDTLIDYHDVACLNIDTLIDYHDVACLNIDTVIDSREAALKRLCIFDEIRDDRRKTFYLKKRIQSKDIFGVALMACHEG